jgi:S-adenosylmethionine decarboxylase
MTLIGCPAAYLNDQCLLEGVVGRAASATGAQVLQVVSHRFTPQGVTAIALLAESHASLHTYPEHGLAYWDCFTCGAATDPLASLPLLIEALAPRALTHQLIERPAD